MTIVCRNRYNILVLLLYCTAVASSIPVPPIKDDFYSPYPKITSKVNVYLIICIPIVNQYNNTVLQQYEYNIMMTVGLTIIYYCQTLMVENIQNIRI